MSFSSFKIASSVLQYLNSRKAKKGASTISIFVKFRMFYIPVSYLCTSNMFYRVTCNSYTSQHTMCNHQKPNRQECSLSLAIYTKVDTSTTKVDKAGTDLICWKYITSEQSLGFALGSRSMH